MIKMTFSKLAGIAVAAILLVTSFGSPAQAQTAPDFLDVRQCVDKTATAPTTMPSSVWLGFCTLIWQLPVGAPEVAFGQGNGSISYNSTSKVLRVTAEPGNWLTVYFNGSGAAATVTNAQYVLTATVGNDGKFIGGAPGACGGPDSFCVTGTVTDPRNGVTMSGVLLRGSVQHAVSRQRAADHFVCDEFRDPATNDWTCVRSHFQPLDGFEFFVNVTNTDNLWAANWLAGFNNMVVEAFGVNPAAGVAGHIDWNAPFMADFQEQFVYGFSGSTINATGLLIFDPANGSISGKVTNFLNPSSGVPGAEVSITGGPTLVGNIVTNPSGSYISLGNLEQGIYTAKVVAPPGYAVNGSDTRTIEIKLVGANNSVVTGVDFELYPVPVSSSAYTTFNQAGWGTRPKAGNAGALLSTYFELLYPTDLVIGILGAGSITETSQAAVQDVLPQEGKALPLTKDYVDPPARIRLQHKNKLGHHRKLGGLAGETLALELNVRFSAFALTRFGLGELKLQSGLLANWTVNQVLAAANQALGGGALPTGVSYAQLEQILDRINKNFQAGTTNNGYLK